MAGEQRRRPQFCVMIERRPHDWTVLVCRCVIGGGLHGLGLGNDLLRRRCHRVFDLRVELEGKDQGQAHKDANEMVSFHNEEWKRRVSKPCSTWWARFDGRIG